MQARIVVRASDKASSIRSFPWPVLESGNGSFQRGVYTITSNDIKPGISIRLQHDVQGAELIRSWWEAEKLSFVCAVAAPASMYRTLHVSHLPVQSIEWNRDDLGEPPMLTPMIVSRSEICHVVHSELDDLNSLWNGKQLVLPAGAKVAIGTTFRFQSGFNGLLDFHIEENLESGRFRVEPSTEDGFKFKVRLAADLFDYLQVYRESPAGRNIMVHIVSAALACLQAEHTIDDGREGWRSFRNLQGLANLLAQNNLKHWSDDDFKPEVAATGLYPHSVAPIDMEG